MGCCATAPLRTTLVFGEGTKQVANITRLANLRQQIPAQFPELKDLQFEMVDKDQVNFNQASYEKALRENHEVTVIIRKLTPYHFLDPSWDALLGAVFRLFTKERSCVSSAFLITDQLALTSTDNIKSIDLKELKAHFDRPEIFEATLDEGFNVQLESGISVIRLQAPVPNRVRVLLQSSVPVSDSEPVTLIYFTQQKPVVNAMDDQKIQKKDGNSSELSKKVQLGSEGAPVFNKNRDLVGVHLAKEAPIVVNSGTILSDMNAKLLSLPPKIQDILQPLIPAQVTYPRPSIPEPTAKESDENFTLNPKQQPEPPKEEEQEHYDIIDLPTTLHPKQPTQSSSSHADPGQVVVAVQNFDDIQAKPIQSFSLFGYAIDLTSHNISILDKSGHMTSRVRDENNFLSGISCLLIPEGLLITGPDPNSSSSAAICTTVEIRDIISMIWDHRYHTSVYFRGAAVIISGLTNAHVERLPSTSSSWERLGLLPELRAYATAIAHGDYIYVLGGIAGPNQDPTTSIFQGDGTTWSRIEMVLLTPLRSAGAFSVRKSLFLFGGYSRGTAANEEVWKLTPATGEMTKVQNFKIEGNLQGMSPAYFSEDVLIPCEGGAVYRFSLDKEKFSQLIDPKVTQPS